MPDAGAETRIGIRLPDEQATARLAEDIAAVLKPGDLVALSGGLGAGKTTFARALLRALAGDPALDVQSPTFPIRLDHVLPRMKVVHADLYRLSDRRDLDEIGLEETVEEGALLVEWPELLPDGLSAERLDIRLEIEGDGRRAEILGAGMWPQRLKRTTAIRDFLGASGWTEASRTPLAGDASYRAYESISQRAGALSPPLQGRDGEGEGSCRGLHPLHAVTFMLPPSLTLPRKGGGKAPS